MIKIIKKIIPAIALVCCMAISTSQVSALEKTGSNETKEIQELRPLGVKIDEIRKMNLAEYYSKLFPEIWNEFSKEEQAYLRTQPYSNENKLRSSNPFFVTSTRLNQVASRKATATAKTVSSTPSRLDSIKHSIVLYDNSGSTWAGVISSTSSTTGYTSTLTSGPTLKVGTIYFAETKHYVKIGLTTYVETSKSPSIIITN